MRIILMFIHIAASLGLISLVLLQHGRGADAGAAFGSGASQTLFGARGSSSFLTRATALLAAIFFITSLSLAYLSGYAQQRRSVTDLMTPVPSSSVPAKPAPKGDATDLPNSPVTESTTSKNSETPSISPKTEEQPPTAHTESTPTAIDTAPASQDATPTPEIPASESKIEPKLESLTPPVQEQVVPAVQVPPVMEQPPTSQMIDTPVTTPVEVSPAPGQESPPMVTSASNLPSESPTAPTETPTTSPTVPPHTTE